MSTSDDDDVTMWKRGEALTIQVVRRSRTCVAKGWLYEKEFSRRWRAVLMKVVGREKGKTGKDKRTVPVGFHAAYSQL